MRYIENKEDASYRKSKKYSGISIVIVIILMCMTIDCGTVEYAYSEASWIAHQIHFQENMDMPNCQWCIDYNQIIP
jgi:hypothetical protein